MPFILGANSVRDSAELIAQSIKFNPSDSTYMQRTYGAGGNVDKWSLSFWFKRGRLTTQVTNDEMHIFGSGADTNNTFDIQFTQTDQIQIWDYQSAYVTRLQTNRLFRDPSAWYHLVFVFDSGNATSGNRAILYINGVRETSFANEVYPSQNADGIVGSNVNIGFGRYISYGSKYFDGYLAEMHYVNGSALQPTDFGETTSDGIWKPIEYTGSYGTGGFYIKGENASDLGNDSSGNGNDMTTSGLASHDQVFDTPINNFCVLNSVDKPSYGSYADRNVTSANLQVTENGDGSVQSYGMGTMAVSSGKWYYEIYTNTYPAGNAIGIGWIELENAETATDSGNSWKHIGMNQRHTSSAYSSWTWGLTNSTATGLTPFGQGVTIGVTTDFDNNTITLTKDGSAYGSVDFDSTSPTYALSGVLHKPILFFGADGASLATLNFGQDSTFNGAVTAGGNADGNGHGNFKYAVPSGALALCTKNLGS